MAASAAENDYVHLFMRMLKCLIPGASHRIAQAAAWEREFWLGRERLREFEEALEPKNDLIVVRLGENVPEEAMQRHALSPAFEDMLRFFQSHGGQLIVTDLFWPNAQKQAAIETAAGR